MRAAGLLVLVGALSAPDAGAAGLGRAGRLIGAPFRYAAGRFGDLLEALDLSVGLGPGVKLDAKYGVSFLGAGRVDAVRLGLCGRRLGLWREADRQLGLFPFSLLGWPAHAVGRLLANPGLADTALELALAASLGTQTIERKELIARGAIALTDSVKMWRHTTWGDSLPVGAEVHAGLIGARVMVRPLQIVDFAVGFVGIDLDPWLAKRPF